MSDSASVTVVRLTAAIACLAGLGLIASEFAGAVRVFPGPAVLAAIVEVPPLLIGFWVLRLLRPVRAPQLRWSAAAVAWGMAAAIGCALFANDAFGSVLAKTAGAGFATNWGDALTGPLDEEILKLCGVALIALAVPLAIRGPIDGLIFGGLVGLGFQAMENFTYCLNAITLEGATNPWAAVISTAAARLATGFGSHWALTAVAGAGIGVLVARGRRGGWLAAALLLLAMTMHFWFDAPSLPVPGVADDLIRPAVNLAVFVTLYLILRRRYVASARGVLATKVGADAISQDAAGSLLSRRGRRSARHQVPHGLPRQRLAAWQQAELSRMEDGMAARPAPSAPPQPAPTP